MNRSHTPTPWHVSQGESTKFTDANGNTIGGVSHTHLNGRRPVGEAEANAAFIVRACNAHDGLLDAAKVFLEYLEVNIVYTDITQEAVMQSLRNRIAIAEGK